MKAKEILQLGKIQRPRGLKGQLRVITTGELLYYRVPQKLTLYRAAGHAYGLLVEPEKYREMVLTSIKQERPYLHIVTLGGIENREQAEELQGLYFGMPLATALKRFGGGNPPYLFEFLHAEVYDKNELDLQGKVVRIHDTGVDYFLEIEIAQKTILVPGKSPYVCRFHNGKLECENLRYLFIEQE